MSASDALPRGWSVGAADDLGENEAGSAVLAVTDYESRTITLLRSAMRDLSGEQVEQLLMHEVAHARQTCSCWRETGHCVHWRRIARRIGYRDAFTYVPPEEEMDPAAAAKRRRERGSE